MPSLLRALVSLCAVVLAGVPLAGQDAAAPPRLGLVLSGGGARGIAHVGVLQVLEELRVPVDCIAGTSMGAIVGGLYAYGLSPDELRALTVRDGLVEDWSHLLRDGAERSARPMRRKQEDRQFLTSLRFGFRSGELTSAKGLLQGQNLETELRWLTWQAHALPSFDQLPIPFRCTAVDLGDGRLVVLDHGNLAMAMRASMSLPMVFAPARIDGREYLDGGLADNVPIDVARAMGAEVLIVVDIGTPIAVDEPVDNLLGVSRRMVDILGQQNVDASLRRLHPADVLVRPDLGSITAASFDRAADAIAAGAAAARAAQDRLRRFAVSPAEYERFRRRQRRLPPPPPVLAAVTTHTADGAADPRLQARTTLRPGDVLDQSRLRADLAAAHDEDIYQRVGFTVQPEADGRAALDVASEAKEWGSDYVRFALGLDTDFRRQTDFALGVQHTARDLNALAAELRTTVLLGSTNSLGTEFYQPLDTGGRWFVAPRAGVAASSPELQLQGIEIAERVQEATLGCDLGYALGSWGEVRAGYECAYGILDLRLGNLPLRQLRYTDAAVRLRLEVDTTDHPSLPSRGVYGRLGVRHADADLGADLGYDRAELLVQPACDLGPVVVLPLLRLTALLDGQLPAIRQPSLGGFLNLSGLPRNTDPEDNLAMAALVVRRRVNGPQLLLDLPVHVGGSVEYGNVTAERRDLFQDGRCGGSVFVAADTPLGAVFVGVGLAEGGQSRWFLFLGQLL